MRGLEWRFLRAGSFVRGVGFGLGRSGFSAREDLVFLFSGLEVLLRYDGVSDYESV